MKILRRWHKSHILRVEDYVNVISEEGFDKGRCLEYTATRHSRVDFLKEEISMPSNHTLNEKISITNKSMHIVMCVHTYINM